MVDQHDNSRSGRELHRVFRPVVAEDQAAGGILVIDMRMNRKDRVRRFRHQPDVDPAVVVTVEA
ncbi:hypothetical protein [Cryobacterium sp. TMS1-13-1]|uniref:hypothetical protein n=1 Tax=Cryobacterium sp. TMS1-13-1 TaxID=1259220 RepID=UPI00106C1B85|nr:hypothetical protein [Cryobacterium sp. TMS1-13-1]TFD21478.1 hypothetical protein E3T31_11800 [Cryobacterium sp. TMS1-13-1]